MDQISTWFDKDSIRARVGEGVRVRLKLIIAFAVSLGFLEVTIVVAGASDEQGGRPLRVCLIQLKTKKKSSLAH